MTRLFNPCGKYREDLCALMSGDLPPRDRVSLVHHLDTCADCQKYRDEIGNVTSRLTAWKEILPDVELSESTQMRWTRDFEAAVEPTHSFAARVFGRFLD